MIEKIGPQEIRRRERERPGDAFDFEEGLHGENSKRLITNQVVGATYNVSPREIRRGGDERPGDGTVTSLSLSRSREN
jgi:hypothetical protein